MHDQLICFLAQSDVASALPEAPRSGSLSHVFGNPEFMLVLGLAAALAAAVFVWAVAIRKRRPTDPHLRVLEPGPIRDEGSKDGHRRHRRRRRRRRDGSRDHRNPTLQETGGLPPPRPDDQLPKV
jgi:hypothetical protein